MRKPPALPRAAGAALGVIPADRGFTVARALCTPQFGAISFTYCACCAAHSGPIFHMVSYAIDCGVPAMAAATVFGAAGAASLSGRVIGGLAADRIGAKRMIVYGLALQVLCVSLYVFTCDLASFYGLALMFGFSYGAVMPLYAILVRSQANFVRRARKIRGSRAAVLEDAMGRAARDGNFVALDLTDGVPDAPAERLEQVLRRP